jgi:signal transduction histidine kinase
MRSIVSSERIEGGPLVDAAADWRAESESRCEAAGLALDWEAAIPQSVRLTGLQRYHLERVVRELVSNALEHSSGKRVSIRIAVAGDRLGVAVADDGRGFARAATTGRGVTGIEQRIARLGGTLVWAAETNGGSRCEIGLPLPPNGG